MVNLYRDALDAGECVVKELRPMNMHSFTWSPYLNHEWDESYPNKVEMKRLQELAKRISTVPEAIEMQSRVAKIYGDRQAMAAGEKLFDWGGAETLAYATLVDEGIPVCLSGEDAGRGTSFTVMRLYTTSLTVQRTLRFSTCITVRASSRSGDSVLSEEAVLAFEYGYATAEPRTLTIWKRSSVTSPTVRRSSSTSSSPPVSRSGAVCAVW